MTTGVHEDLLVLFDKKSHELRTHMSGVVQFLGEHPDLRHAGIVHSFKSRLKEREHLREKLIRKALEGREINSSNLFREVTDLAGVRILHLYQEHFREIDQVIRDRVKGGDWVLDEMPKAYTWDPEAADFFANFEVDVVTKPTYYTSVHYLVRPREDSPLCCEVQVRTLFEEIWGEVDHQINYPKETQNVACKEQLRVLSKIVGAGSRLLDSLSRVRQAESPDSVSSK